jgi:HlyD family secretion protein
LLIVVVLAVAGALTVFALRPAAVSVTGVTRRDIAPAVQGVGTVEAKVVVQVSSKITGRIVAVLVDQGDVVEIGQLLVRLDEAQLRADVQRSEAAARAADAHLP